MRACLLVGAAVLLAAGAAVAADAIKVELKDFEFKAKNDGTPADLFGHNEGEGKLFLYAHGSALAKVTIPEDGEYTVVIEASCDEAKNEKAKIKVTVGDVVVKDDFALTAAEAKEYKFPAKLKKGEHKLGIEFLNDEFKEGEFDRNLYIHKAAVEKK
jgi:hypothetical protein